MSCIPAQLMSKEIHAAVSITAGEVDGGLPSRTPGQLGHDLLRQRHPVVRRSGHEATGLESVYPQVGGLVGDADVGARVLERPRRVEGEGRRRAGQPEAVQDDPDAHISEIRVVGESREAQYRPRDGLTPAAHAQTSVRASPRVQMAKHPRVSDRTNAVKRARPLPEVVGPALERRRAVDDPLATGRAQRAPLNGAKRDRAEPGSGEQVEAESAGSRSSERADVAAERTGVLDAKEKGDESNV